MNVQFFVSSPLTTGCPQLPQLIFDYPTQLITWNLTGVGSYTNCANNVVLQVSASIATMQLIAQNPTYAGSVRLIS